MSIRATSLIKNKIARSFEKKSRKIIELFSKVPSTIVQMFTYLKKKLNTYTSFLTK